MYCTCETTSAGGRCKNGGWTNLVRESDEVIVYQNGVTSETDKLGEVS